MAEIILGWEVERLSPTRVRLHKDGSEVIDMKGSAGVSGDDLVKAALDRVMAVPPAPRPDAHVIEVPTATAAGAGHNPGVN